LAVAVLRTDASTTRHLHALLPSSAGGLKPQATAATVCAVQRVARLHASSWGRNVAGVMPLPVGRNKGLPFAAVATAIASSPSASLHQNAIRKNRDEASLQ
jgi:hypothetical protein